MRRLYLLALCAMLFLLLAACGCQHEWKDATCDAPKTCTLCGVTEGEALNHQWQDATCTAPKTCALCSKTEGEALGHVYDDSAPDCENPKICSTCGQPEGKATPHTWLDADCANPKTCSVCAKTEGEPAAHQWLDATCTAPKTCENCGLTEGEATDHTWVDATCDTTRTCSACGATEGAPLGHSWLAATCETAKTCENCGATDGEAKGHSWQEATCVLPKICSACHTTEGKAKGHDWKEATSDKPKTCRVCGETDGSKLDVDPRFKTSACKFLFGQWKELCTESMELEGVTYTLEYWYYYEFQKDGTVLVTMVVDDEEAFLETYEDMMVAVMYATYAQMGMNKSQADADFRATYNMSIPEYCELYAEEYFNSMTDTVMEGAYYVEDNVLYFGENWKSEFHGEEFEVIDGEVHITYSDGSGVYILIPVP